MIQGSDTWHKARLGKITASRFKDVLAKGRGGEEFGKTAMTYAYEIVTEIETGEPIPHFTNEAMEWGTENEPYARIAYEEHELRRVHEIGFLEKDDMIGGSPDGLVGKDGMIEIKCPYNPAIHRMNVDKKTIPAEYTPQVQGLLWITDRKWCDFVSFDPRPGRIHLVVIRVERDEKYIEELVGRIEKFKKLINEILKI